MIKICKYCGKEFDTNRKNQVYCSDKCLHSNYSSSIGEAVFFLNQYIEDIFNSAC